MTSPRRIIIDTDPGQDDAVAILLALGSPELEVVGITAVAGNVPLKLTEKNARKICELAGRSDIPVFAGAVRPLLRELVTAEEVHGQTGLERPGPARAGHEAAGPHAVDFIVETLMQEESGSITLCALGPLTNIALALAREPGIAPRIREIVLMGGGFFEGGNITPAAEFNIYVDPHAADIVLRSGVPIVMMPLDVTHKALTTARRTAAIPRSRHQGRAGGRRPAGILRALRRAKYGTDGGPLHDPCVIAYLIKPELFKGRDCNVVVETASELTMGMTVVDWWGVTKRPKNALVMRDIDHDGFFALLTERSAGCRFSGDLPPRAGCTVARCPDGRTSVLLFQRLCRVLQSRIHIRGTGDGRLRAGLQAGERAGGGRAPQRRLRAAGRSARPAAR